MASNIKNVLLVMSGKGGVGKSSVTVQLAKALLESTDLRVGVLDIDLCGPSIPRMLGLEQAVVHQCDQGWTPVYVGSDQRLAVMSIGFLLGSRNDAVIWRGPKKTAMIRQFIEDVVWPELDILLVDTPPGTSDEHMAIVEVLKKWRSSPATASTSASATSAESASNPTAASECAASSDGISSSAGDVEMASSSAAAGAAGAAAAGGGGGDGAPPPAAGAGDCRQMACSALLVTTPQNVSVTDVRRQLAFCRKAALSVLGVLENMSGYVCPHCSECTNIFSIGGGEELCRVADVPFLGRLPLTPSISHALDAGSTISYTPETQMALNSVVTQLTAALA